MRRILIVVFDGVEELDFCGPYEVFSVANRMAAASQAPVPYAITLVGEHGGPLTCAGGLKVLPDATMDDCARPDILVVPGGAGTRRGEDIEPVVGFIRDSDPHCEIIASVCTGALLLARAGLLDGRRATTHWASLDLLQEQHPAVDVVRGVRFVDEGRIITAGGISAGIDLALHVVERTAGPGLASLTAQRMEYAWRPACAQ
ncbi:MAG: DJ-1/PfpI family protein [Bacillota bacterium]|nr:DJ-1/PfpI family protein [Bacillota bacterium]